MEQIATRAARIIARCRELAQITDVPGETTRLFLSPATQQAHTLLASWFHQAGLTTRTNALGSLHALRPAATSNAPTLLLVSHIDTVPNAGAFDGPLGVLLAVAALEELHATALPFAIEIIAFSEEEGVRFGVPFLSSLAATNKLTPQHLALSDNHGITVAEAIRTFGLDPAAIPDTCPYPTNSFAAIEVHIEQGPVLDAADGSLAVVEGIVGQSRYALTFTGQANHAGTTPMPLRKDALAAAAEWLVEAERYAAQHPPLVATVGRLTVAPNATNVVPGVVTASLDVRHPNDAARVAATTHLLGRADTPSAARGVTATATLQAEQPTVPLNAALTAQLQQAAQRATGHAIPTLYSGAGHDAMILAPSIPTAMLFLRSPGGLSHHPGETVREQDVEAALATLIDLLQHLRPVP